MTEAQPPPDLDTGDRAHLLPEERAVGSEDPEAQAAAILAESEDRTENPDPDDPQAGRRRSEDTV